MKFGGHQAAVGLTVRKRDFPALREGLMKSATAHAEARVPGAQLKKVQPEADLSFHEANTTWWQDLQRSLPPLRQLTLAHFRGPQAGRAIQHYQHQCEAKQQHANHFWLDQHFAEQQFLRWLDGVAQQLGYE